MKPNKHQNECNGMIRKYKVAVILINYNSSKYTINCIRSIYQQTSKNLPFQVIVIDNNSEAADYQNLDSVREYSDLKIIRSRINTGFATGCMTGVQHSNAEYYFFLNNDCILMNDCLSILTKFMDDQPLASICSPQLFNETHQPTSCFNYRPDLLSKILGNSIFRLTRGRSFVSRKSIPKQPIQVEVLSGSQLFARATDFETIGGFDTTLFLYCEEEDLAFRAHQLGMQMWLVPAANNSHIGGASTTPSIAINREFLISFFYFYEKHYGKIKTIILRLIYALKYLKKSIKSPSKISLVLFILLGSHMKYSLRQQQKIAAPEQKES